MSVTDAKSGIGTLVELLRRRAAEHADKMAYVFPADRDTADAPDEVRLTYAELDRQARAVAARLQALGLRGERALLVYPPGPDFLAGFFGCLYAGVIAVPAYPPRPNRSFQRLAAIVAEAQPRIALTTEGVRSAEARRPTREPALADLPWLATDHVALDDGQSWREPALDRDTIAFLQYTSGSTSAPKGVILSHGNVLHNLGLIRHGFQLTTDEVAVFWLPLYHDMGLVGGILEPMLVASPSVVLSTLAVLQRPARWLEAITRYRGTISGAPNFAYQLCLDRVSDEQRQRLDLGSWRVAFSGAEPIRAETLDAFARAFGPAGFRRDAWYPCYGLAETAVFVSGGSGPSVPVTMRVDRAALEEGRVVPARLAGDAARTLVGCGRALLDQRIAIVDPETATALAPGRVGEIWVSSPSVGQGYWNQPDETERSFRARLVGGGDAPFLRTGDLGFFHDGELFVVGRLKDLILVDGRNHYPQDVEQAIERCHPALRPGGAAAFAVEVDGRERLVVVQEVERHARRDLDVASATAAIRRAVSEQEGLGVHAITLVEPLAIPRTSSGKVQRRLCRAQFLEGSLPLVAIWHAGSEEGQSSVDEQDPEAPARPAWEIVTWLVGRVARDAGVRPTEVDPRAPFAALGLSSVQAVGLAADLEAWIGRPLAATLAYDYPTIESLARHLAGGPSRVPEPSTSETRRADDLREGEPVAIVGIGCRFPGASGPEGFWTLLRDGVDAVGAMPTERADLIARFGRQLNADTDGARWGGFLAEVDRFDARFFGIAPREAERMDPQQRLLLEVAWEALEDAGVAPEKLAGRRAGVFVGIASGDYGQLQAAAPDGADPYSNTGSALSIAANRLSYAFDLRGPSLAVDTACSSSLVAVHLACQSLRQGECDVALAGGVNVLLAPNVSASFVRAGFLAPDGRCKAFDARADGYVRGEGTGIVVLKPLSRALADGDRVYAVIHGSAVNNDGRSNGLTAPSRVAQEAVLREAYRRAAVPPGQVGFVEAHGTGTALGDPIEASALGAVLGEGRSLDRPCLLGAVKTNVGHLEAAAGIAGLIKTALVLHHREVPPNLHFREPNPHIPFDRVPLRIPVEPTRWPDDAPGYAGVSAFGFGGTNAHVVLGAETYPHPNPYLTPPPTPLAGESPPPAGENPLPGGEGKGLPGTAVEGTGGTLTGREETEESRSYLLPISGRGSDALGAMAGAYRDFLDGAKVSPGVSLRDVAYSASVRRGHHDERLALVARTLAEAREILDSFLAGRGHPNLVVGRRLPGLSPKVAFVFSGQGQQRPGMGLGLYEREPAFHAALDECDRALRPHLGRSIVGALREDESGLVRTEIAQPAIFALQVALAAQWRAWGVTPDAVVGHSLGEVAAAHVAGALSLDEAARLVVRRGRVMQRGTGQGRMLAVALSEEAATRALAELGGQVTIAAINGPASVVLAGSPEAIAEASVSLRQRGVAARELPGDYAFHSMLMEPFRADLERALVGLAPGSAEIPMISTVSGQPIDGRALDAGYWSRQIRAPVRFAAAIGQLIADGYRLFVELGPRPVLTRDVERCLRGRDPEGLAVSSFGRGGDEDVAMLLACGSLYVRGCPVDWEGVSAAGGHFIRLPRYPFQRQRYWLGRDEPPADLDGSTTASDSGRGVAESLGAGHSPSTQRAEQPLLGRRLDLAFPPGAYVWEGIVSTQRQPYLRDHRFQGVPVLPGAAFLAMAIQAWTERPGDMGTQGRRDARTQGHSDAEPIELRDVELRAPLLLGDDVARVVQVVVSPVDGDATFHIASRPAGDASDHPWTLHALGRFARAAAEESPRRSKAFDLAELRARVSDEVRPDAFYDMLRDGGLEYGPSFRGIARLWRGDGEALGEVVPRPELADSSDTSFHPAGLDACAQVLAAIGQDQARPFLPDRIDRLTVLADPSGPLWSYAVRSATERRSGEQLVGDVRVFDAGGRLLVEARGLRLRALDAGADGARDDGCVYSLRWRRQASADRSPSDAPEADAAGTWLIFADNGGIGKSLAHDIAAAGGQPVLISSGERYERVIEAGTTPDLGARASRPRESPGTRAGETPAPPDGSARVGDDFPRFRVRLTEPDDLRQLFATLSDDARTTYRAIVYLAGLDLSTNEVAGYTALETDLQATLGSVVALVQALASADLAESARLWIATRGAQAVGGEGDALAPLQATLWGLGRTIALEHPERWGGLIDLDPRASAGDAARLRQQIAEPGSENQVARRGEDVYVARLVREQRTHGGGSFQPRADATYLITGGLGGLGRLVAGWLVERGARRLILAGRSQLPPRASWADVASNSRQGEQIAAIRALEARGAAVHLAAVDVGDADQLTAFLETFRREGWPPIRGVVHAAGVIQDQLLARLDAASLAAVLRAKVAGGWLLDRLLDESPLDFFVCFSSATALLGSPGQASYAAANAFLDALAHTRRARGRAATTIDWGPWDEVGLAVESGQVTRLAGRGVASLPTDQALDLFGHVLATRPTQVAIARLDWPRLVEAYPTQRAAPLFADLPEAAAAADGPSTAGQSSESIRATLQNTPPAERRQVLEDFLRARVGQTLRLPPAEIDRTRPLSALGLDSLMGVEVKNRIEADLGVSLPVIKLLEEPSVADLASYLLPRIAEDGAPRVEAPRRSGAATAVPILDLQAGGTKRPLILVHPGALDADCYAALARHLGPYQPVRVLQPPGLESDRSPRDRAIPIEAIAARCIAALRTSEAPGPLVMGGWSLGGIVAFEVARQLATAGETVGPVALLDSPLPWRGPPRTDPAEADLLAAFASYLAARHGQAAPGEPLALGATDPEVCLRRLRTFAVDAGFIPPQTDAEQLRAMYRTYKAALRRSIARLDRYAPSPAPIPIVYARASTLLPAFAHGFPAAAEGWGRLTTASFELFDVPGDHYTLLLDPNVVTVAECLAARLDRAAAPVRIQ